MTSSRQYKCDARDNYIRIFYFTLNSWWLQYVRSARDQSNRWIITFTASPAWAWPTPRRRWTSPTADIAMWFAAYSGWGSLPPACRWWTPLSWRRERRLAVPPNPTVASFPDFLPRGLFPPPSNIEGFVSFGHEEGDEAMSISASEKEDWAGSEPELSSSEPSDLQEKLMRVLSKAVQELELTWNPPEEPVRSKLNSWYFRSTCKADSRASVPFFPDVHEQLVKTWSVPQSACVHSNTQAMFSHVDGAEAHGYVRSPPVEETVAAHLCPAAAKT